MRPDHCYRNTRRSHAQSNTSRKGLELEYLDRLGKINELAKQALATNPALESVRIVLEDYLEDARNRKNSSATDSANTGTDPIASGKQPVVLLVGPDENIYMVLRLALHDIDHQLLWAQEEEALSRALDDHVPDVVVAEAQLSSGGGFQLMQMVKSRAETADLPVILLSRESFLESIFATHAAIRAASEHHDEVSGPEHLTVS